jgi:hypothetical protein
MYDAIDVNELPQGGDLYAGYDDGNWPDADSIAARFPGKEVLRITVNPADNKGVIGDGPPDNGTWPEWVQWVEMRRAAGEDPWLNTNQQNNWQAGKDAFAAAGVPEPHWWVANYDGDPALPAGALMKQYASNSGYDTSSCAAYLPGIDPKPVVIPPKPPITLEEIMQIEVWSIVGDDRVYAVHESGKMLHINEPASLESILATKPVQYKVSPQTMDNLKAALGYTGS